VAHEVKNALIVRRAYQDQAIHTAVANLNKELAKGAPLAAVAPKIMAQIRDIQEKVDEVKFERGHRQTVVQNLKSAMKIVEKAAARAARTARAARAASSPAASPPAASRRAAPSRSWHRPSR
jgi:hypothetical protein